MKKHSLIRIGTAIVLASCSSSSGTSATAEDSGTASAGDPQTPPTTSAADIEAWLAKGYYQSWHCEAAATAGSGISPHGAHRVCSNDVLSGFTGTGEYPVGSANVKELYDAVGGKVIGHAIELHTTAGTSGTNWFWYEDPDGSGDVADATGVPLCVSCHSAAGSDSTHPGHDFVYVRVD